MISLSADVASLLQQCEQDIRAGRADLVSRRLATLTLSQVPRSSLLPLAKLCRRAGLIQRGLRLLAPLVRPDLQTEPATTDEKAEYAFLMMKNGSLAEAQKILQSIDGRELPEATLYLGFCHAFAWDYANAIPYLTKYLAANLDEYQSLVAKVNLVAALNYENRLEEASKLVDDVLEICRGKNYSRLLGNSLELRSQISLSQSNFRACHEDLNEAQSLLGSEGSSDQLFILKWRAFATSLENGTLDSIHRFRKEAIERKHWESVRECDFYSLKTEFNQQLFDRLYGGTMHAAYRARLTKEFRTTPQSSEMILGSGPSLDLATGKIEGRQVLKTGSKIHRAMDVMTQDLYRPLPMGTLFSEIFPDEYFDPFSSINRVHQVLWRVRDWARDNDFGIRLEQQNSLFRLQPEEGFALKLTRGQEVPNRLQAHWLEVERLFSGVGQFKSSEAVASLQISPTTFRKVADWAIHEGRLSRSGASSGTWYEIKKVA